MDKKQKFRISALIYGLIFLITSAPVFCGYIPEGGDMALWMGRIQEIEQSLAQGSMSWFPTPAWTAAWGGGAEAFDCGIWLLPLAAAWLLGMGEQIAYCLFMGLVQLGTMAAARWVMGGFSEKTAVVLWGTLFYMGCPCHIYVCFDKADLGQALVWALVPGFIGGMARLCRSRGRNRAARCVSAAFYAGIWYADARWGVIVGGCAVLYLLLWERRGRSFLSVMLSMAAGGALAMPSVLYLTRYLIKGGMQVWNLPLGCIMENGYAPGLFLTTWVYRPDLPGMGIGYMGGILLLAWLCFRGEGGKMDGSVKRVLLLSGILTAASLQYFPWDLVQRLGAPFLRFVGLLETPGIFWGAANMLLAVPAGWAVGELRKKKDCLRQWVLPLLLLCAVLATALYMCNTLTYVRPPLGRDIVSPVVY